MPRRNRQKKKDTKASEMGGSASSTEQEEEDAASCGLQITCAAAAEAGAEHAQAARGSGGTLEMLEASIEHCETPKDAACVDEPEELSAAEDGKKELPGHDAKVEPVEAEVDSKPTIDYTVADADPQFCTEPHGKRNIPGVSGQEDGACKVPRVTVGAKQSADGKSDSDGDLMVVECARAVPERGIPQSLPALDGRVGESEPVETSARSKSSQGEDNRALIGDDVRAGRPDSVQEAESSKCIGADQMQRPSESSDGELDGASFRDEALLACLSAELNEQLPDAKTVNGSMHAYVESQAQPSSSNEQSSEASTMSGGGMDAKACADFDAEVCIKMRANVEALPAGTSACARSIHKEESQGETDALGQEATPDYIQNEERCPDTVPRARSHSQPVSPLPTGSASAGHEDFARILDGEGRTSDGCIKALMECNAWDCVRTLDQGGGGNVGAEAAAESSAKDFLGDSIGGVGIRGALSLGPPPALPTGVTTAPSPPPVSTVPEDFFKAGAKTESQPVGTSACAKSNHGKEGHVVTGAPGLEVTPDYIQSEASCPDTVPRARIQSPPVSPLPAGLASAAYKDFARILDGEGVTSDDDAKAVMECNARDCVRTLGQRGGGKVTEAAEEPSIAEAAVGSSAKDFLGDAIGGVGIHGAVSGELSPSQPARVTTSPSATPVAAASRWSLRNMFKWPSTEELAPSGAEVPQEAPVEAQPEVPPEIPAEAPQQAPSELVATMPTAETKAHHIAEAFTGGSADVSSGGAAEAAADTQTPATEALAEVNEETPAVPPAGTSALATSDAEDTPGDTPAHATSEAKVVPFAYATQEVTPPDAALAASSSGIPLSLPAIVRFSLADRQRDMETEFDQAPLPTLDLPYDDVGEGCVEGTVGAAMSSDGITVSAACAGMYDMPMDDSCQEPHQSKRVDLHRLGELIASAEPTLEHLVGKKVVALMGATGSGKTTLVNFVAGKPIQKRLYCKRRGHGQDSSFTKEVYVAENPLEGFSIGHDQVSETTGLMHYVRKLAREGEKEEDEVVYLDSSGYEDTVGIEVDIATSISFCRVAQVCGSIRFVVLVNCASLLENRGGAIRGLVRLVSACVRDFDKFRLAFTFLFTHTDLLPGARGAELDVVRATLRGILYETAFGTEKDANVRAILRWMHHCLQYSFPFVDVFHPELSDPAELTRAFERFAPEFDGSLPAIGLAIIEKPSDVVRCGMTLAATSMVKLELDRLLGRLRVVMPSHRFTEISSISQTLDFLQKHLELDLVSDAYKDAVKIVEGRGSAAMAEAFNLVEQGTNDHDDFSVMMAQRAIDSIATVNALTSTTIGRSLPPQAVSELLSDLQSRVGTLGQKLQHAFGQDSVASPPLNMAQRWLTKLRAWANVNLDFVPAADAGVLVFEAYIVRTVAECQAARDPIDLVLPLARLQHVCGCIAALGELGIKCLDCEQVLDRSIKTVKLSVQDDEKMAVAALLGESGCSDSIGSGKVAAEDFFILKGRVDAFRTYSERLEALEVALCGSGGLPELAELARRSWWAVRMGARCELETLCNVVTRWAAQGILGAPLQMQVLTLKMLFASCTDKQRAENNGAPPLQFSGAIEAIVAVLEKHRLCLDVLCEHIDEVGIGAPKQHVAPFLALVSCTWLDGYLTADRQFVKQCLGDFKGKCCLHFKDTAHAAGQALQKYLAEPKTRAASLTSLHYNLPEMEGVGAFGVVFPEWAAASAKFSEKSMELISFWAAKRASCLSEFPDSLEDVGLFKAAFADEVLAACRFFAPFQLASGALQELASGLERRLERCCTETRTLFEAPGGGRYTAKSAVLNLLAHLAENDLRTVAALMPELGSLRDMVRDEVASKAREIRGVIREAIDCTALEVQVLVLAEARVVDAHIGGLVSNEVDSLRQMLEMRRAGLDDMIRAKIEACDFEGICDYVAPLQKSNNDPVNKRKFHEIVDAIASRVKSQMSFTHASVQSGTGVTDRIRTLERACDDVGDLMRQNCNLQMHDVVHKLHEGVNTRFAELLEQLASAERMGDFAALVRQQHAVVTYHASAKHLLATNAVVRAKDLVAMASKSLDPIDDLVDAFVNNVSKPSNARVDISTLVDVLAKLKNASSDVSMLGALVEQETELPAALSEPPDSRPQWVVVGGGASAGISVRRGRSPASVFEAQRLLLGAILREVRLEDGYLQYELCSGEGPSVGWVPLTLPQTSGPRRLLTYWSSSEPSHDAVVKADNVWRVSGYGTVAQDVAAQVDMNVNSRKAERRLANGALVRELDLQQNRLHFETLAGSGPTSAWTTVRKEGKDILIRLVSDRLAKHGESLRCGLSARRVIECYRKAASDLCDGLNALRWCLRREVEETQICSKAIEVYMYLKKEWDKGLRDHLPQLGFDIDVELEFVQARERERNERFKRCLLSPHDIDSTLLPWFDGLRDHNSRIQEYWRETEYTRAQRKLDTDILGNLATAKESLAQHNFELAGVYGFIAQYISQKLHRHISDRTRLAAIERDFEGRIILSFRALCEDLASALEKYNLPEFEALFLRYHKFVKTIVPPFQSLNFDFRWIHERICVLVESKIKGLKDELAAEDFVPASKSVAVLRQIGHVLTGAYAVYYETIRGTTDDKWLSQLNSLCTEHFGGKSLAAFGVHYAILEIAPNASEEDIEKAYQCKIREYRPDMSAPQGIVRESPQEMMERVEFARRTLSSSIVREEYRRGFAEPFSELIKELPRSLRDHVRKGLDERSYDAVRRILVNLCDLHVLGSLVDPPLEPTQVRRSIHDAVKEHVATIRVNVSTHWSKRELKSLHEDFLALSRIDTSFSAYSDIYSDDWRREINRSVEIEIEALSQKALSFLKGGELAVENQMSSFALQLILLGRVLDELPLFKDLATMKINDVLETCQEQAWGFTYLFKLGMMLEQGKVGKLVNGEVAPEDQRVGKNIVAQFKHFKDVLTLVWNEQTEVTQKDISATVEEVKGKRVASGCAPEDVPVDKVLLLRGFKEYKAEYDNKFHAWRAGQLLLPDLAKGVVADARKLQPCTTKQWTRAAKDAIPRLLAGVAVYFTVLKSGDSYTRLLSAGTGNGQVVKAARSPGESSGSSGGGAALKTDNVLMRPHSTQVLTVLRLFGFDDIKAHMSNQLMQIRTGEGKAMILGLCSVLFGLLGFRVRTVCYSEYLSERDHGLFRDIFAAFGVGNRVVYSKITALSEDTVAAKGDIRALTANMLRGKELGPLVGRSARSTAASSGVAAAAGSDAAGSPEEEILLADEVDVFFGPDYYGQTHNQVALLDETEAYALLHKVWELRGDAANPQRVLRAVMETAEYGRLLEKFPSWRFLVESEVASMCFDLEHFNTPPYHFDRAHNRIGYKVMDGISYDVVYGYGTAFAYLNEWTKGTLRHPEAALRQALQLRVSCGQFSYANINPACILGVSGTVEAMGNHEWRVMNQYGIETYTHMPSVYGERNFRFMEEREPITVVKTKDLHFVAVTEEVIQKARVGRAAIVFFEDAAQLAEYETSPYYKQVNNKNVLRESQSTEEKEYVIKKAATTGQATFTTAVFGRGTDFFCSDPKLHAAGGVHVVQAFFSAEKSLEVQIQGRTARQGKKGTYCMVLLETELTTSFDLRAGLAQLTRPDLLYNMLEQARQKKQATAHEEVKKNLLLAEKRDKLTHKFFDALLADNRGRAVDKFKELYKTVQRSTAGSANHIVFCLDESGSMTGQPWLDLVHAFSNFVQMRIGTGSSQDLVSVVQFDRRARATLSLGSLNDAQRLNLNMQGGGTCFKPALHYALHLLESGRRASGSLTPVLVFMSDGMNEDGSCVENMGALHSQFPELQCHTIFFGHSGGQLHLGGSFQQHNQVGAANLQHMAAAVAGGAYHLTVNGVQLAETFAAIAASAEFTATRGL